MQARRIGQRRVQRGELFAYQRRGGVAGICPEACEQAAAQGGEAVRHAATILVRAPAGNFNRPEVVE